MGCLLSGIRIQTGRKTSCGHSREFIRAHRQRALPTSSKGPGREAGGAQKSTNTDFLIPKETAVSRHRQQSAAQLQEAKIQTAAFS